MVSLGEVVQSSAPARVNVSIGPRQPANAVAAIFLALSFPRIATRQTDSAWATEPLRPSATTFSYCRKTIVQAVRSSSDCGIVNPSASAVLRLIRVVLLRILTSGEVIDAALRSGCQVVNDRAAAMRRVSDLPEGLYRAALFSLGPFTSWGHQLVGHLLRHLLNLLHRILRY